MYWCSQPIASLPKVPHVPMKFDDSLPVIPPPAHLHQLITHVDAAHANELRQRCSTTGYGCCLAGGVMACCSHTQSICAQSSTEAELIVANAAAKVPKYLRFILHELGYTQTEPTPIYEDITRLGLWQVRTAPISYPLLPASPMRSRTEDRQKSLVTNHSCTQKRTQDLSWKVEQPKNILSPLTFSLPRKPKSVCLFCFNYLKSSQNFVSDHGLQDFCQPLRARRRCF